MTLTYTLTPGAYRTRDGQPATVTRIGPRGTYPVMGYVGGEEQSWTEDGSALDGCVNEPLDLVERVEADDADQL